MQDTRHHPEKVQLLCVVQADLLHGHAHPVEVALVVKERVSESARLLMLRHRVEGRNQGERKLM